MRIVVLAAFLGAVAGQSVCPYTGYPPTAKQILVFGEPYCNTTSFCLVDSSCAVVSTTPLKGGFNPWENAYSDTKVPTIEKVDAIGDISKATSLGGIQQLVLWHCELVSIDKMALPQELSELTLQRTFFPTMPTGLPVALKKLWLEMNLLPALPDNLPSTLTHLRTRDTNFTEFPVQLRNLEYLSANSPTLTRVADRDWSKLAYLDLGARLFAREECNIKAFVNVTLSSKLRYINFMNCNISQFHISQATFAAIKDFNILRNTTRGPDVTNYRAGVENTVIRSDAAACAADNGTLTPLWPSFQNETYETYTVCITPDVAPPKAPVVASTATTEAGDSNHLPVILGASFGGVALIALIAFALVKRRRHVAPPSPETPMDAMVVDSTFAFQTNTNNISTAMQEIHSWSLEELAPIKLDESSLELRSILGSGASADVWFGYYRGDAVAIKRFLHRDSPADMQAFVDEIQLLQKLHSPYIVRMIGASWTRPTDLKCILEYMDLGDLREYLANHSTAEYTWRQKTRSMYELVLGIQYLHAHAIIHRDLKSRNVLLDSKKGTKLTDFGVARVDVQATMTAGVGTFRWMAPEVLMYGRYSVAADIYSFGP
ncbi:protein kinase [Achlya hypogyna]|uniref:Protein kinase n=1 Tax=Achlya hypogyna TaxID=1202772 RepID=A0A1V9Z5V3_ACHHY|nr:protein kinase [Achlya hypogyna]